jgi:hypothetical protein
MAYSNFTASELKKKFGVKFTSADLFTDVSAVKPSDWLVETLKKGRTMGIANEKSRSERLVSPVLTELNDLNNYIFAIHSGVDLNVDEKVGLNGECDFIFSYNRIQDFLNTPIFCITEAKKQDIEQGTIQCAAQLIAARKFNESEGEDIPVLYGCSTTGLEWRFLKYENDQITLDENWYLLTELPKLLGVLQEIVNRTKKDDK